MKSLRFFISSCFSIFSVLIFSCATKVSDDMPDWCKENWKSVFPDSEYMAARGTASEAEIAKTDALAQISRYIGTSVNANLNTSIHSMDNDGIVSETIAIQNEVAVNSQVDLFGAEFTEPYFIKKENKWYCVAYIDRKKAWTQYVPQIESAKAVFAGFYENAETEDEPLFAGAFYKKAWEKGKDFLTKLEYGRILQPAKEAAYSADRTKLSLIPSKIETELKNIIIQIEIEGDYGNIIETSIENSFKKAGFTVSRNGNYKVQSIVELNEYGKEPVAVFPSIDLKLSGISGKTVYSYSDRVTERSTGFSLETALKRAYPKLAEKIEQNLLDDFSKMLEAK